MSCEYCCGGKDMLAAVDGRITAAIIEGGWSIEHVSTLGFVSDEWSRMVIETVDGEIDSIPISYCPMCGERLEE